jgi:hypothetical protein
MKTTKRFINRLIALFLGSMHQMFGVISDISSRYPGSGHKAHDHLLLCLIFSIKVSPGVGIEASTAKSMQSKSAFIEEYQIF